MDFNLVQYACDLRVWVQWLPPFDLQGREKILVDLYGAARATCHVPPADPRPAPMSFRRFGTSIGATPVPIGPAVRALCPEMLGHTHRHTHTLTNTRRPTFFASLGSVAQPVCPSGPRENDTFQTVARALLEDTAPQPPSSYCAK